MVPLARLCLGLYVRSIHAWGSVLLLEVIPNNTPSSNDFTNMEDSVCLQSIYSYFLPLTVFECRSPPLSV